MTETATDDATGAPAGGAAVAWLDGPPADAVLGGKASALVRLLEAGLPVPPGFVILPPAFTPPGAPLPGDPAGEENDPPPARLSAAAAAQVRSRA